MQRLACVVAQLYRDLPQDLSHVRGFALFAGRGVGARPPDRDVDGKVDAAQLRGVSASTLDDADGGVGGVGGAELGGQGVGPC